MARTQDAFELLTLDHDHIEELITRVASARDLGGRSAAFDMLAEKLVEQLATKQELVYPLASAVVSAETLGEVLAEHSEIKLVLADLLWLDIDDPQFEARLETLACLFDGHRQWQEAALFVALATTLSTDQRAWLDANVQCWVDRTDWMFVPDRPFGGSSHSASVAT